MHQTSPGAVEEDSLHVRVLYAAEMLIDEEWDEQGVCSTYWRYYVNYRTGPAVRLHDGTRYELPPGFVHLIPPWVRIDLLGGHGAQHLWAHFDIVGLPGGIVREVFATPASLPLSGALKATAEAMRQALDQPQARVRPDAIFSIKAAIQCALAVLFAGQSELNQARISAVTRFDAAIGPALRQIATDLHRSISVPELARACGYAPDHFSRLFRAEVGQTPAQYILECRVALAAQQLVLSDCSIDAIAEACGFPDRFYFSRVFTKRMGVPPARYRRAQPSPLTRSARRP